MRYINLLIKRGNYMNNIKENSIRTSAPISCEIGVNVRTTDNPYN